MSRPSGNALPTPLLIPDHENSQGEYFDECGCRRQLDSGDYALIPSDSDRTLAKTAISCSGIGSDSVPLSVNPYCSNDGIEHCPYCGSLPFQCLCLCARGEEAYFDSRHDDGFLDGGDRALFLVIAAMLIGLAMAFGASVYLTAS